MAYNVEVTPRPRIHTLSGYRAMQDQKIIHGIMRKLQLPEYGHS
jgi:hypothetical protein